MELSNDKDKFIPGIKFLLNLRMSNGPAVREQAYHDLNNYLNDLEKDDDFYKEYAINDSVIQVSSPDEEKEIADLPKKMLSEMDILIKDIMLTRQKINCDKLKAKIKTKEDFLNLMNINDKNNCKMPPEPIENKSDYYKHFSIDSSTKQKFDFQSIKEKLKNQEEKIKLTRLESSVTTVPITHVDNSNSIFDEIRQAECKFDDMLTSIDECIKMGEDIDRYITQKSASDPSTLD